MAKQKVSGDALPGVAAPCPGGHTKLEPFELLDDALDALVERELERRWLEGHDRAAGDTGLPGEVPADLTDVPWDSR